MNKVVAYCLAGSILLLVADVAPRLATATTSLILLGVAITHADQLTAISNFIRQGVGEKAGMASVQKE